jgi:hypothetical protein
MIGYLLLHRLESKVIEEIVKVILHKLSSSFPSITDDLVGIDSSVEELITSYLGLGNNVGMIGICGMGDWERQLLLELFMISFLINLKFLALLLMLGKFQKNMVWIDYKSNF